MDEIYLDDQWTYFYIYNLNENEIERPSIKHSR